MVRPARLKTEANAELMRVGLVSAAYPPDFDGIGDYTWWMAKALAERHDVASPVRVFTSVARQRQTAAGIKVVECLQADNPRSFVNLRKNLGEEPRLDWLILQYNPFGYGRRGFCPWVPSVLRKIKRSTRSPRIATMFHETVVPRWPWKFGVMYLWQYPIFRAVCQQSDVAFISTERWLPQVRRASNSLKIKHLPVGSNIPRCKMTQIEARQQLNLGYDEVILAVFGSAHISRSVNWIGAAARAIAKDCPAVTILYVGPDGHRIAQACSDVSVIDAGALPAEEVGIRLRASTAALAPFVDGISTRRGSVIALLQHGIPVATTQTAWTDRVFTEKPPTNMLLSTAESADTFARDCRNWMARLQSDVSGGMDTYAFYERNFNWTHLAAELVGHLG